MRQHDRELQSSAKVPSMREEKLKEGQGSGGVALQSALVHSIGAEPLQRMLYYMMLTRELEDRIERKLYRQGKIVGGVYVGRGQEAISVGSSILTRPEDVTCPSHRDMGAFLIRGMTPPRILAQYMGRRDGYTRGRDGNMHMGDLKLHVISFVSMLADNVPVAAGVALTFKMRKEDRVVLCYFGDGATSRGDWHEGLNFAAVEKLPVVYICNNNQYAYSTPVQLQMAVENVADRAPAYGMLGEIVDGNDVLAVYDATRKAIERARAGLGPTLLECKTFRMTGHSAHDDASYVSREVFEEWKQKDPISRYQRVLLQEEIISQDKIEAMRKQVIEEVDQAVDWAERSPYPEPEECLRGVYYED
jgi:TPP-dependent pyruvate/acetoin dehydrogenase alpha subunit